MHANFRMSLREKVCCVENPDALHAAALVAGCLERRCGLKDNPETLVVVVEGFNVVGQGSVKGICSQEVVTFSMTSA